MPVSSNVRRLISYTMPVFISHKREDSREANTCLMRLQMHKVPAYLDELDHEIEEADDLTTHFITKLQNCTHLIAAVSRNTQGSWWVPFEIGAATALERRICSTSFYPVEMPDFLAKWPKLSLYSDDHYARFAIAYHSDSSTKRSTYDSVQASIKSAGQFHATLKRILGQ
jgi:hypothetical protein